MLDMMQFCGEGTLCENFLQSCQDGVRVYELSVHPLKYLGLFIQIYYYNQFYLRFCIFKIFSILLMMAQRTDCNRGVGQHPTPSTNTNSLHPLHHNGNVSSEVKEFFGDPSTSVEALEAVCGDGSLQNIHKCTSKNCLLSKYIFRPGDNVVSTVTHCSYPCINKDGCPVSYM